MASFCALHYQEERNYLLFYRTQRYARLFTMQGENPALAPRFAGAWHNQVGTTNSSEGWGREGWELYSNKRTWLSGLVMLTSWRFNNQVSGFLGGFFVLKLAVIRNYGVIVGTVDILQLTQGLSLHWNVKQLTCKLDTQESLPPITQVQLPRGKMQQL